ncbi:Glutamate receptor 3.3 isoform 1 [Dorcoceras hygrometricum]|uniref:Glutamate receptor 3.3 isoform 1 n=1 Tax=Dorcoceras hygrometricum TaxID=472368 RepID=A0A2Z7DAK1_9LAMI|nr:Glutamate receptor 3.3 isoform 1 [Dorcoceras hygrometricum]
MRPAVAQQIAPIAAHSGLPAAPSIARPCAKAAPSSQPPCAASAQRVRTAAGHGRPPCAASAHGIQLAVGPQPSWLRNHNFGLAQRIMVKRLATSPHDPLDRETQSSEDDEDQLKSGCKREENKETQSSEDDEDQLKSGCKREENKRALNGLKKQPDRTRPDQCRTEW